MPNRNALPPSSTAKARTSSSARTPTWCNPWNTTWKKGDTTGITVYSLGNFISNQSKRHTNGGIALHLTLTRTPHRTRYRMRYLSNYVHRPVEPDGIRRYYVIPEPDAPRLLGSQDSLLYRQFFEDTDHIIGGAAEKYPPID